MLKKVKCLIVGCRKTPKVARIDKTGVEFKCGCGDEMWIPNKILEKMKEGGKEKNEKIIN